MNTIHEVITHVGNDGVIHLELAAPMRNRDVLVTIAPMPPTKSVRRITNPEEWHAFVERTYGSLADAEGFEVPNDPPPEPLDLDL